MKKWINLMIVCFALVFCVFLIKDASASDQDVNAGSNVPKFDHAPRAGIQAGTFYVTGTQTIAEAGDCSSVTVNVTGEVEGTVDDDGEGNDIITIGLWDDGDLKDSADVVVAVGEIKSFSVTLRFPGIYSNGAAGVGVYAYELGWQADPFYPTEVAGSCVTAPLHDTDTLIMTTGDYSNFANSPYFTSHKANHNGTDLALSADGSQTASLATASTVAVPVYAHAICDGQVMNSYYNKKKPDLSFMQVYHPNCGGQDIVAYYGNIYPTAGLTNVSSDDTLGTIMKYNKKNQNHLHLTLDADTDRDLSTSKYYMCDYVLDAPGKTVTALSNCSLSTSKTKPALNQMLLLIGYGKVNTTKYMSSKGKVASKSFYISEDAMRDLGFISYFDIGQ